MSQLSFKFEAASLTLAELALLTPEEIYSVADEYLLQTIKEDRRLERKSAGIHGAELGEYFSMWANTVNGGLIVVGQEDNGAYSGCLKLGPEKLNSLESAGAWHCPEASFDTRRIPVTLSDGNPDFILLILVYYHPKRLVRDVRGKVYVRVADRKTELTNHDKIRALEVAKGQVDLEQEPVDLVFPDDFNLNLVHQYVEGVKQHKKLTSEHSDKELLANGRLGKLRDGKFVPNTACALLFAKDPIALFPGCKVRVLRYDGENEETGKNYNVVKQDFIEGPIPEIIVRSAQWLRAQLREFSSLGSDNRFYTAAEYPEPAWYEALVNACVHRSYILKNMVTFVKMFDDKLVIESPGGFPPPVSPETIYNTHSPRNPHLMQALFFMEFVKCHNEGTRRMRDSMSEMNLPKPEFAQKEVAAGFDSVRVTLRNNIKLRKLWIDSAASKFLGAASRELTPNELRILNFVAEYGKINVSQAHKLVSTPKRWHTVKKLLEGMAQRGLLLHHHSPSRERDPNAHYTLPAQPRS